MITLIQLNYESIERSLLFSWKGREIEYFWIEAQIR